MPQALGTVRANNAHRIIQCFDGSLQLALTQIKIDENLVVRNAPAALSTDVEQNPGSMAWATSRIDCLQKPRKVKAHLGVVCGTPAHWLGGLLTRARRVDIRPGHGRSG